MTDHKSNKHETESQPKWAKFNCITHSSVAQEINAQPSMAVLFWDMDWDI